ncbi:MAG: sugar transferase [Candidatus Zhuqueibacterota bacterium]
MTRPNHHCNGMAAIHRFKRMLDLALLIPLLLLLIPLFIGIITGYALNMLFFPNDRGPIFHRVFRKTCGRIFIIFKFRVSRISPSHEKSFSPGLIAHIERLLSPEDRSYFQRHPEYWREDQGAEKTHFGQLLKKFYMDELPQVFNIFIGEMTIVGPRPVALYDPRNLPDKAGRVTIAGQKLDYQFRNELKSGITGYYQLNKDYRALENYEQFMFEGVQLDRQYYDAIRAKTGWQLLRTDLAIILKTLSVVVRGEGI